VMAAMQCVQVEEWRTKRLSWGAKQRKKIFFSRWFHFIDELLLLTPLLTIICKTPQFRAGVLNTWIEICQSISKVLWVDRGTLTLSAPVDRHVRPYTPSVERRWTDMLNCVVQYELMWICKVHQHTFWKLYYIFINKYSICFALL